MRQPPDDARQVAEEQGANANQVEAPDAGDVSPASPPARRGGDDDDDDDSEADSEIDGGKDEEGGQVAPIAPGAEGVPNPDGEGGAEGEGNGEKDEDEKKEDEHESYQWRMPLVDWRTSGKEREYSPEFELDGEKWRLLCFPRGNPSHPVPNCMAAYIELRDKGAWYRVLATFKFRMIHPTDPSKSQWKEASHTFSHSEVDRGFNDLVTPATIHELTHPDGCVVLEVSAWKAPEGFQERYGGAYEPYDSKSSTGFCGLLNQGATCYMNSMLQALYLLPKFREVVYAMPNSSEERGAKIGYALQRVFYALQTGNKGVSTKQLTQSFGWGSIDSFMQHDVQEFCRVLLDSLDTTAKKTSLGNVIASLFEGKSQAYIKCINVDFKSQRDETFWDLSINVKGCKTIRDSFAQYVEEEILDGDNKYRAEGHGLQAAKKGTRFTYFPPVLQLQLKRFEYDPMRDQMVKINDRFEFPTELDLTDFLCDPATGEPVNPPDRVLYSLHSVLVHSGGVHGGHYYSYIRPFMQHVPYDEAPWFKFDDETVTKVSEDDAVSGNYGGAEATKLRGGYWGMGNRVSTTSAYMLIYVRKSSIQTLVAPGSGQPAAAEATSEANNNKTETDGIAADKDKAEAKEKEDPKAKGKDKEKEKEKEKGKGKKGKEKEKEKEKVLPQYLVPIPESLTTRFKAEEEAEKARQEERKRAFMYMQLKAICESDVLHTDAVGADFETEQYDPATGYLTYVNRVESEIKVLKKDPLSSIGPLLTEKFGIPEERQELWMMRQRQDCPRPAVRIDVHGAHGQRHIEDVMRELSSATYDAVIYLRDRSSHVRELVRAPVGATAEEAEKLAATPPVAGETTRLILFKYFDIPTQKFIFLGSTHFSIHEYVAAVRAYAATLLKEYVQKQTSVSAAASVDGADPSDELVRSMSKLSIDAATASNLAADDILTWFELNGHGGKAFAFNPLSASEKEEIAARGRQAPDWNTITIEQMKVSNGEICLFNIKYTEDQLKSVRDAYVRKYDAFQQEHDGSGGAASKVASQPLQGATPAGAALAATPALFNKPYKSRFAASALDELVYLANRIVLEFRANPYTPPKKDPAPSLNAPTETDKKATAAADATKEGKPPVYQRRPGVVTLELMRTDKYDEMIERLANAINSSPDRIKLYRPSIMNDDQPDSQHLKTNYTLDLATAQVSDVLSRMRDAPHIFYYSIMEYTWKELEKNIPLTINYNDQQLNLWTWQSLVPKNARCIDLVPMAVKKVEELRATSDPSYHPNPNPPIPSKYHFFAIDYRQTVRELRDDSGMLDLREFAVNGVFTLNMLELTPEEESLEAKPNAFPGQRKVWIRRYYPLGGVYWRPAGLPFTFIAKEGEKFSAFRKRVQARLHYDDAKMEHIEIARLTQKEHTVITNDDDEPWQILADDLRGIWTCLGLYDPVQKKPNSAQMGAGGGSAFKSLYTAPVKFKP